MKRDLGNAWSALLALVVLAATGCHCGQECARWPEHQGVDAYEKGAEQEMLASPELQDFAGRAEGAPDKQTYCRDFYQTSIRNRWCLEAARKWSDGSDCCHGTLATEAVERPDDQLARCKSLVDAEIDRCGRRLYSVVQGRVQVCAAVSPE